MNLRKAPVTVVVSLLVLSAWALSFLGMYYLGDIGIPRFLFGTIVFFVSLFAGAAVASQLVKPLGPLFEEVEATKRADYLGQSAQMTTGKVTPTFGQAEIKDGGAGLLVQVRCDEPNQIGRGDEVLLVDFDAEREAYIVEGMKALVGNGEGPVETGELSVGKIEKIAALERELAETADE